MADLMPASDAAGSSMPPSHPQSSGGRGSKQNVSTGGLGLCPLCLAKARKSVKTRFCEDCKKDVDNTRNTCKASNRMADYDAAMKDDNKLKSLVADVKENTKRDDGETGKGRGLNGPPISRHLSGISTGFCCNWCGLVIAILGSDRSSINPGPICMISSA